MTDVPTLLAGIKERAEKATEGPWHVDDEEQTVRAREYAGEIVYDRSGEGRSGWAEFKPTAAFIAAARTDVPRLIQALEAVAKVHEPVDALMNPGRQERVVKVCTGCGTDDGNWQRWPCPTITAVVAALGEGEGL